MPQMMPMNWIYLSIIMFFLLFYLILIVSFYFLDVKKNVKFKLNDEKFYWNWKW